MRWDALFDDLEAQAALLEQAERAAEVDERTRGEVGRLGLAERARAALGTRVRLHLAGAGVVAGRLTRVGPDWWLLDEDGGREAVIATVQLLGVHGLARHSAVPGAVGVVESRIGLRQALRGIARDRSPVQVLLVDGTGVDGTVDRVGADFLDIATHAAGEPRRAREVREVEIVPLTAVAAVRRSL